MLSIIISSYQPKFFSALEKNISETCGVPFELIRIDNPAKMSISEAYNLGAKRANFENLLFLHEDVLFHTENWGENLVCHLADPETGIVGVAGSNYVPTVPCGWYIKNEKYLFMRILQNSKKGDEQELLDTLTNEKQQVYGVDGVFLAMKKEKFLQFGFKEEIKVFHGYDLDICLNVAKKYKNYVVGDILLEHFSLGGADKKHFDESIAIRKRYGSNYQNFVDKEVEMERFENFMYSYFRFHGITLGNALKTLRFLPLGKIRISDYLEIAKAYIKYFRFKDYFIKRFN